VYEYPCLCCVSKKINWITCIVALLVLFRLHEKTENVHFPSWFSTLVAETHHIDVLRLAQGTRTEPGKGKNWTATRKRNSQLPRARACGPRPNSFATQHLLRTTPGMGRPCVLELEYKDLQSARSAKMANDRPGRHPILVAC
jgi:hypothetical protein